MSQMNKERKKKGKKKYNAVHAYGAMLKLFREDNAKHTPVSYTHLTLPTILLV